MLHFRSKAEIADLPIWIHTSAFTLDVSDDLGIKKKLGDLPNLLGALDIGSCFNIKRFRTDVWVHDWNNTGVTVPGGIPTGYTQNARFRASKDFERGEFAYLALIFDYNSIFYPSFGEKFVKTYANEAERMADATLTSAQVGFVFKQTEPVPATLWILLKIKEGDAPSEWMQLKELLPAKKAAYVSMMGGGFTSRLDFFPYFPLALFLGTNYVNGKFTDAIDPDYPTHLTNDPVAIGAGNYVYDPPIVPPAPAPANALEQIGKTVKADFLDAPRLLVRFNGGIPRYKFSDRLLGFLQPDSPPWPEYDDTPRRRYWPDGTHENDGSIPDGPDAEEHNYSWFIRDHTFPDFVWHFPSKYISSEGDTFYYEPGTVNAGYENENGKADYGFQGMHGGGNTTPGRHTDYLIVTKLDMDILAQEEPTEWPPADPTRYIRDLRARR